MPESLPMKTRLLLAGASLQLISLAKKSEKKEKKQKVVTGLTARQRGDLRRWGRANICRQ